MWTVAFEFIPGASLYFRCLDDSKGTVFLVGTPDDSEVTYIGIGREGRRGQTLFNYNFDKEMLVTREGPEKPLEMKAFAGYQAYFDELKSQVPRLASSLDSCIMQLRHITKEEVEEMVAFSKRTGVTDLRGLIEYIEQNPN